MRLSVSTKGTYYFGEEFSVIGVIRKSLLIEGNREEPKALSDKINAVK
jgi:hypothetical protein